MFVDEVDIHVTAGRGGRGCLAFRREKYVPRGGPSGGDGGHGGSIYIVASPHINTLINFRFHPEFDAQKGGNGEGSNRTGRNGDDLTLDMSGDDDDASETLDLGTIHSVYSRQGAALGRCLSGNGGGSANISFIIHGPTGRVTLVRVNGKQDGGLATCITKVMKSLAFPTINGPRTRAEFDISM